MALLDMLQDAAVELRMPSTFTSVIGNTDAHVKLLLALANAELKECRRDYQWPQLIKVGTITLASGTNSYELPGDFDSFVADSEWDTGSSQPLYGPISAQDWNALTYGVAGTSVYKQYRIEGHADTQLFVYPTPASGDAGTVLAFRYKTSRMAKPKAWAQNTTFAAGSYCSNNGVFYYTSAGGTTGTTEPTHLTGDTSDGGVTWSFYDGDYSRFTADTDTTIIDQEVHRLGVIYRFKKVHKFDYVDELSTYGKAAKLAFARLAPSPRLRIDGSSGGFRLIDDANIPDTI